MGRSSRSGEGGGRRRCGAEVVSRRRPRGRAHCCTIAQAPPVHPAPHAHPSLHLSLLPARGMKKQVAREATTASRSDIAKESPSPVLELSSMGGEDRRRRSRGACCSRYCPVRRASSAPASYFVALNARDRWRRRCRRGLQRPSPLVISNRDPGPPSQAKSNPPPISWRPQQLVDEQD